MEEKVTRTLLTEVAERAVRYLDGLETRAVAPMAEAIAQLEHWDGPLPDAPTDAETVVRLLDEIGSPATMAMAGPRFFGFVIGGALPAALAANWLAGAWDQNTAYHKVTPGTVALGRDPVSAVASFLVVIASKTNRGVQGHRTNGAYGKPTRT